MSPDTAQAKAMADPSPETGASQPRPTPFTEFTFGFEESEIAIFELGFQKGGRSMDAPAAA